MRNVLVAIFSAGVYLFAFTASGQNLSMTGVYSEIEDAFLEKPNMFKKQERKVIQVPGRSMFEKTAEKRNGPAENKRWKTRLENILDIPESPVPEGILLEMLKSSGPKFLVAVYDTGEKDVVHKARQVIWSRIRTLFIGSEVPFVHIMPVSGGTFSVGKSFYTIINEMDGFNVFYIPRGSVKKMSLAFSGGEGTLLTPEGFVCRIKKYASDAGEDK